MNTKSLCDRLVNRLGTSFTVEYWDNEKTKYGQGPDSFVLRFKDEGACRNLFPNLSLGFGEGYMAGRIEVGGDLEKLLLACWKLEDGDGEVGLLDQLKGRAAAMLRTNTIVRSRRNASHHYDVGNPFFKLWLGREMAYSCAYFRSPDDDIDTAQEQKAEYLCRKLRLSQGQSLLDIGCGWGGLVLHAAEHYGARAVGVTLSREQQAEAMKRVATRGLQNRVQIRLQDYREIPTEILFDRIVSVGMFEHVGEAHIGEYMAHTARLLANDGLGVLHTMGRMRAEPMDPWLAKYIFPGGYFPTLAEIIHHMGRHGLHIIDVESLRPHYYLTLHRWIDAFEANVEQIRAMYDETFVRMWRLYLRSAAASFRSPSLDVWQIQFCKGVDEGRPLTREYLYSSSELTSPALHGLECDLDNLPLARHNSALGEVT